MRVHLLNFILLLLLTSTSGHAEDPPLAVYDLKIFDYKLGMTYEEAISVRAFHYTVYPAENQATGIINSAYIEDVEFNTAVYFQNDVVFKIVGRFDPKQHEKVLESLKNVLGEGEESTKNFNVVNGTEVRQSICKWNFPGARIDLICLSNNTEFATLSMMSSTLGENSPEP